LCNNGRVIRTATGGFEIGYRRMDWETDARDYFSWVAQQGVSTVDLRRDTREVGPWVREAGLEIGCVDLLDWDGLGDADADVRARAAEKNAAYIADSAAFGAHRFMIVTYAEDQRETEARVAAFADGFRRLSPVLRETGSRVVIEGIPRGDVALWRPSSYRQLFAETAEDEIGINFDPSHLWRARINPLRFLAEFGGRVFHSHAKDTERIPDAEYEWGSEAAYDHPQTRFSGRTWRYVLPGRGDGSWPELLRALAATGYTGRLVIEPEDDRLVGIPAVRAATVESGEFLAKC